MTSLEDLGINSEELIQQSKEEIEWVFYKFLCRNKEERWGTV
jgi:hypothetical protein